MPPVPSPSVCNFQHKLQKGLLLMWIVFTALRANIIKQKSVSSSISSCCFHIAAHTCCISAFRVRPVDKTLWARWRQQVNVITFEVGHMSWQSHSVIFSILLDEVDNALRVNQCEGGCVVFFVVLLSTATAPVHWSWSGSTEHRACQGWYCTHKKEERIQRMLTRIQCM